MKRTTVKLGLVLFNMQVKTRFGKTEKLMCLADSAGQTLLAPAFAKDLIGPKKELITGHGKVIGVRDSRAFVDCFRADLEVETNKGIVNIADVQIGILPNLAEDAVTDVSGLPAYLGYEAMQLMHITQNVLEHQLNFLSSAKINKMAVKEEDMKNAIKEFKKREEAKKKK